MIEPLLQILLQLDRIHFGTKTIDQEFHEFTEDAYKTVWDAVHSLAEDKEDIWDGEFTVSDLQDAKNQVFDLLEQAKRILEENSGKYGIGTNFIIGENMKNLQCVAGTARSYARLPELPEDDEEEEEEDEQEAQPIQKSTMKNPLSSFHQ